LRVAQLLLELLHLAAGFVAFLLDVRARRDRGIAFLLGRGLGHSSRIAFLVGRFACGTSRIALGFRCGGRLLRGVAFFVSGITRGLRCIAIALGGDLRGARSFAITLGLLASRRRRVALLFRGRLRAHCFLEALDRFVGRALRLRGRRFRVATCLFCCATFAIRFGLERLRVLALALRFFGGGPGCFGFAARFVGEARFFRCVDLCACRDGAELGFFFCLALELRPHERATDRECDEREQADRRGLVQASPAREATRQRVAMGEDEVARQVLLQCANELFRRESVGGIFGHRTRDDSG
jgi:hypothetical protein